MEPAAAPVASHRWVAQSFENTRDELAHFARTFWSASRHPVQFAARWVEGEAHPLNPLAFFLTGMGFIATYRSLLAWAMGAQTDGSFWVSFGKPVFNVAPVVLTATLVHLGVRKAGSRRHVTDSIGIVLYMAAGPGALCSVFQWPAAVYQSIHPHNHLWTAALLGLASFISAIVYVVVLTRALKAIHGVRWRWMLLAVIAAFAVLMPPIAWMQMHHPGFFLQLMS